VRVLHVAYSSDPAAGVARQMAAEQVAADRCELDWKARFFVPAGTDGAVCVHARSTADNRLAFKREYYRWLTAELRECDVLLLRYLRYDPMQLWFLARAKKPVFLVHHTLEGPQILQEGGSGARFKHWLDKTMVRRCHALSTGLVAVTEEVAAHQRDRGALPASSFLYPNGIAYDTLPSDRPRLHKVTPRMLFVASRFVEWHGLDLLVDAARRSHADFRVDIVGELSQAQREALAADARFVVHGSLPIAEVESIAARCGLGLGSFALFRKDMYQACTLKVREYLLAGLPVFAGHADVFDESLKWYRHGECEIEAMLDFLRECGDVSRRRVAEDARSWIDKERLLTQLHDSLREVCDRTLSNT